MKKKSIEEQIVIRILSDANKSTNYLACLSGISDGDPYTSMELEKYLSFLIDENFELANIDMLNKILENLKKLLVKRINIISQNRNNKNFYELTILLLALESLRTQTYSPFESDELIKNDRVQLCYNLAMLIVDHSQSEEQKNWFNENLKKLRFN